MDGTLVVYYSLFHNTENLALEITLVKPPIVIPDKELESQAESGSVCGAGGW